MTPKTTPTISPVLLAAGGPVNTVERNNARIVVIFSYICNRPNIHNGYRIQQSLHVRMKHSARGVYRDSLTGGPFLAVSSQVSLYSPFRGSCPNAILALCNRLREYRIQNSPKWDDVMQSTYDDKHMRIHRSNSVFT